MNEREQKIKELEHLTGMKVKQDAPLEGIKDAIKTAKTPIERTK